MKVSAAIVVAGGVGFLFHENHDLNADLTTLNKDHKATVHQLAAANKYAKEIEQHQKEVQQKTDKLSKEVEKLTKEKESLNKEKQSLAEEKNNLEVENKELQQKNSSLTKEVKEQKSYPRQVKADTSSVKTTSTTKTASPVKQEQIKKASATNGSTNKKLTPTTNVEVKKPKVETVSNQVSKPVENTAETKQVVNGVASAYTLNEPGVTGVTASGKTVQPGMVAMDSWVPLGTKVRITCEDYPSINGVYEVADRGGAIDGNRVDIYMTSLDHAIDFGKRNIKIEILN